MIDKMKVFVSVEMNGRSEEEIRADYELALDILEKEYRKAHPEADADNFMLIDSYIKGEAPEHVKDPGLWYLGECIKKMAECDIFCSLGNYEYTRGCKTEREAAYNYGLCVVQLNHEEFNLGTHEFQVQPFMVIKDKEHIFG